MNAETERVSTTPAQSLTVSALWLLIAKAVSFLMGIVVPLLMVRRLNKTELGHYNQIFQAIATVAGLLPFGFGMTVYYFFPREPARRAAVCFNVLLVTGGAGLAAAGALLIFPGILPSVFGEPALLRYVPLVALLIPLTILAGLFETFAIVQKEFRLATIFIITSQISRSLLMLSAVILFQSVRAVVFAAILQTSIQTAVLFRYLGKRLPGFWRAIDRNLLGEQLLYAAPLGLAGALWIVQGDLHNYVVSRTFGAAVFAVYAVGCVDLPLIGVLSESAASVMIGRVSELRHREETAEIIGLTARVARKLALVFFPVYAFLMVAGKELIVIVYTVRYLDSLPVFRVNITILLLSVILLDPICRAYPERMSVFIKVRIALCIAMAGALWLLVGRFGPVAAITIVIFRTGIENAFGAVYYARVLGVKRADLNHFMPLLRIAACSALAAAGALVLHQTMPAARPISVFLICGIVFCLIYVAAVLLLGILTTEEKQSVGRLATRWARFNFARATP